MQLVKCLLLLGVAAHVQIESPMAAYKRKAGLGKIVVQPKRVTSEASTPLLRGSTIDRDVAAPSETEDPLAAQIESEVDAKVDSADVGSTAKATESPVSAAGSQHSDPPPVPSAAAPTPDQQRPDPPQSHPGGKSDLPPASSSSQAAWQGAAPQASATVAATEDAVGEDVEEAISAWAGLPGNVSAAETRLGAEPKVVVGSVPVAVEASPPPHRVVEPARHAVPAGPPAPLPTPASRERRAPSAGKQDSSGAVPAGQPPGQAMRAAAPLAAWSLDKLLDSEDVPDYPEKQQDAVAIANVLEAPEPAVAAPKPKVEAPQEAPPADFNAGLDDAILEATKGLARVPTVAAPVPDAGAVKATTTEEADKVEEEGAGEVAGEAVAPPRQDSTPSVLSPLEQLARGELTPPASSLDGEAKLISSGAVDDAALGASQKAAAEVAKPAQAGNGMQNVTAAVEAASKALVHGSVAPLPPASTSTNTTEDDADVQADISHFDSAMDTKVKQLLSKDVVEPTVPPAKPLSTAEKLLAEDIGSGWLSPLQKLQQAKLP
mmetsp:Transcript_53018/g.120910  ORF Transcript_53018/g.120910 Transcript_53018/m.120910 type:complete len:547 (+) Transcript_53018:84-1724(+)|eukprot:CAMPEP_0204260874 /NCGR_PEP_ID=MMETSP0468-20130131/6627_1 /ASSEMBLY_ACC=CAM_ASM_000383 /TAXON_ID=2969 /ORGANISM="Oxyrrhis marina" /LENGTH=546 /DNA_ID=CAMNT_0051235359 /DNA_START=75 /DNA_END=1715 /DNA_ORIENTATION=-